MKINHNQGFVEFFKSFLIGVLIALLLFLLILAPAIISIAFDFIKGKEVLNDALTNATKNSKNPDEIAMSIMA